MRAAMKAASKAETLVDRTAALTAVSRAGKKAAHSDDKMAAKKAGWKEQT